MVTICFGGSVLAPEEPNVSLVKEAARAIRVLKSERYNVLVVTGGGGTARKYMGAAKILGTSGIYLDKIGIDVSRLNARMLISALGNVAEPDPVTTVEAAVRAVLKNKVPVMGGTNPGQTTDTVAAMVAKASRSDVLVFFSDVDGIYTADPKRDPLAKKIERMTTVELANKFGRVKTEPGMKTIIDPVAAQLIERSKMKALFLGVEEMGRLPEILKGANHNGTTIIPVSE